MVGRTEGIRLLVQDVLRTLPEPYGEDVIEDVFVKIQGDPEWHRRYDELVEELTLPVVNSWIAKHTKATVRFDTLRVVDTRRTELITCYRKLVPA